MPYTSLTMYDWWERVDRQPGGCWMYQGPSKNGRYGSFGRLRAHHFAWMQENGPVPAGRVVCHKCDVPLCVNPAHLFLGTQGDNVRDACAKGRHNTHAAVQASVEQKRAKTHCVNGHEYTEANTRIKAGKWRACRECGRQEVRERRRKGVD